jgi:hypothetical protein
MRPRRDTHVAQQGSHAKVTGNGHPNTVKPSSSPEPVSALSSSGDGEGTWPTITGGLMSITQGCAITAAAWLILGAYAPAQTLTLARSGRTQYHIVIAEDASALVRVAAEDLQHHIAEITGAEPEIGDDTGRLGAREIVLGDNAHLRAMRGKTDLEGLGPEGYVIRTSGQRLIIVGATDDGTANGVYGFLQDHLGCRWLAADCSVVPQQDAIVLEPLDEREVPPLLFREVYQAEAMDPEYARRNRLNGNASIIEDNRMVSERHRGWDMWCHSFFAVVPPDKYLQEHPEYFSLVDGRRQAKQLCLTNPEVLEVVTEALKQRIAANPEAQYISVSQMDWGGACQCDSCRAVDEREGTPMGSLLEFINKLAARFPDRTISTLSYTYTRRPPKTIAPAGNVLIVLCSIECNRSRPIETDPSSAPFREDVVNWSKICDNVLIWDYVVQFANLVSPFPNLRVLQPNVRFFVQHGATGMFAQGSREVADEFAELRSYLLARLLWDPEIDVDRVMDEFLAGYYGPAAGPIREYVDLMHASLEASGAALSIYHGPGHAGESYLTEALVAEYGALFEEAEALAADDAVVLARVQRAHMPVMFAQLELGYGSVEAREGILEEFMVLAERTGLQRLSEWGRSPQEFELEIRERLQKERGN